MTRPGGPVALVLPTLGVGGTERHVAALAASLAAAGRPVLVVCVVRGGPLAATLASQGVEVVVLGASGVTDPRAPLRLLRLFLATRPSVVHAFLFGFDGIAALPARLARVPLVLGSRREIAGWMRARHLAVQAAGTALVDLVVCCAWAARREALAAERGDAEKYVVLHNGVDVARFRPSGEARRRGREALALGPSDRAVVTVANHEVEKGHAVLLAAARGLREAGVTGVRFLWAGDGPRRGALGAAVAAAGLGDRIRFLGPVDDVPSLLAAADAFVLPSLSEGLPNALLEAMAAGLPIVATAAGGVGEAVSDGREALLVPPGDAVALARAIERLLGAPELGSALGDAAHRRAERQFALRPALARFRALYASGKIGDE